MTTLANSTTTEIARIIWPEAMDGETENGRLDEAEALDKAEAVIDEVRGPMADDTLATVATAFEDYRVIKREFFSDLEDALNKGNLEEARELLEKFEEPTDIIDAIDVGSA